MEALTLTRGYMSAYPGGAGISMNRSQGTITRCILVGNQAGRDGGGISIVDSWATLRDCAFRNNSAGAFDGGGIFCYRSVLDAEDCTLVDNLAQEGGGIAVVNVSTATIRRCVLVRNQALGPGPSGGAIIVASSSAQIENNTMVGNQVPPGGASVALYSGSSRSSRNIIAFNTQGGGVMRGDLESAFFMACNDLWGNAPQNYVGWPDQTNANGNIAADPLFCDLVNHDYRIADASPCAANHSPAGCELIGALDVGCGPVTLEPATWGRIKSRFR